VGGAQNIPALAGYYVGSFCVAIAADFARCLVRIAVAMARPGRAEGPADRIPDWAFCGKFVLIQGRPSGQLS
jgi:hypothetical protein